MKWSLLLFLSVFSINYALALDGIFTKPNSVSLEEFNEICFFQKLRRKRAGICQYEDEEIFHILKGNGFQDDWFKYYPKNSMPSENVRFKTAEITEVDIRIRNQVTAGNVYHVLKHELLHGLGFSHVDTHTVMHPSLYFQ